MKVFTALFAVLLIALAVQAQVIYNLKDGNQTLAESILNALDRAIDPCDDFYQYACGGWLKNVTIPEDRARFSRGFDVIGERNEAILRDILEKDSSIPSMLKTFFQACMNTTEIEREGTVVIEAFLSLVDEIERTGSLENVFRFLGVMHSLKLNVLFDFHVEIDAKVPTNYLGQFTQGGLQLPERSFYSKDTPEAQQVRTLYKQHMTNMFNLLNIPGASDKATQILAFETALANIFLPGADLRDPFKTYNKRTVAELKTMAPLINWDAYREGARITVDTFNVIAPTFFENLSRLIGQVTVPQLTNYMRWVLIHEFANYLPAKFRNETFNFYGKVLLDEQEMPSRISTCLSSTDESIGFLLAQPFVQKVFNGESKTIAVSMIKSIEDTFKDTLNTVDWMDETTRDRALKKLSLVVDLIGYPNTWPTYNMTLSLSYIRNKLAARTDAFNKDRKSLTSPVDRDAWGMTPSTVNAYYEPTENEMCFPAAILQNPYFNKDFPLAINFGGMGMIMGHELSHGFDDQGRLYDGYGKLENWWTPIVNDKFDQKAACFVKQYNGFEVLPGYFINGNLTLGENIADNAGIKDAYRALIKLLGPETTKPSIVNIFNNAQLFFVAFAQGWCTKARDAFVKQRLLTDVHSPPKFRVIGPLSNLKEFSDAFSCPTGSRMNPANKCVLF